MKTDSCLGQNSHYIEPDVSAFSLGRLTSYFAYLRLDLRCVTENVYALLARTRRAPAIKADTAW
jgi:hypothetical protein